MTSSPVDVLGGPAPVNQPRPITAEEVERLTAERERRDEERRIERQNALIRRAASAPTPLDKPEAFVEGFEWARAEVLAMLTVNQPAGGQR